MVESDPPSASPEDSAPQPEQIDFPCGQCGAKLTWNPDSDALSCAHCGTSRPVPRAAAQIVERPLSAAGDAARGLGSEQRALRCNNCGATVELDTSATADGCVFCGSSNVLAQSANRNLLRPESLVPLDVGRATVEQNFRRWIGGLWFRPSALKSVRQFDAIGVYLPYWTFDARVHSTWSADAGYYYYETRMVPVTVNGRTQMRAQQVRKIRWVPKWGERRDAYDDVLVHASRGVPEDLAAKLGQWDTRALVPYRPEYLAGWRAEEYQVDLESAWSSARERIVASQRSRCAGDVPGDTQRNLRVHDEIDDVRWKHILLPLWTLSYRFQGKSYTVLVHGQTGRVHGRAPLSWIKILLCVLALLVGLALAALLVARS
ncbi:MAG: zinc ribbon domain-containing protein [Planctomycetes bacterium]|nr:zinc ribbon domain-containing protein [Planctomycetota bacterium]